MILGVLIGAAAAVLMWALDLPLALGAHPFWSTKVILYGAPIGVLLFLCAFRLRNLVTLLVFAALTIAAFLVAHQGKTVFAASFAENATAGKAWFYGWIATSALVTATSAQLGKTIKAADPFTFR